MTYGLVGYLSHPLPFGSLQLKLGAGGFVSGIQCMADGTKFCRTDTSGAYIWNTATSDWGLVNVVGRMPGADASFGMAAGAYAIAAAPSNTSRLYMYTGNPSVYGYIFRSDAKGLTWTRTGFASVAADPNDQGNPTTRLSGPYMRVHPTNPDIVFVSTPSSGLWKTTNGGSSWAQVTAVGTSTTPVGSNQGQGHLVEFDPSDATGNTVYVSTYGTGVYKTTTGGPLASGWTLQNSSGMPTTHIYMEIGTDGTLWLVDGSGGSTGALNRYLSGTWSTQVSNTQQLAGVAVDPSNPAHVYTNRFDGELNFSLNANATTPTWNGLVARTVSSPDIPWIASAVSSTIGCGMITFDPSRTNTLMGCWGVGVFKCNPPITNVSAAWVTETKGVENLATTFAASVPGGPLALASQDRPLWLINAPASYPTAYFPTGDAFIDPSYICEYATSDNTFIASSSAHHGVFKSINSGVSFNDTTGNPAPLLPLGSGYFGGNLAIGSPSNMVYLVTGNNGPYYTLDGGATWNGCTISGGTRADAGWHQAQYYSRVALCADRVDATTYYLYNDGGGTNTAGVYKSTDGITFTHVQVSQSGGPLGLFTDGAFKMRSVPNNSGHLFASSGVDVHGALPNTLSFYKCTDHGVTWAAVPNVKSVFAHGYGKANPSGSGYPAVFVVGYVSLDSGVTYNYGMWRSDNANLATPTWVKIGDGFPLGIYDVITWIEGDLNTYGRVYVGFLGSGSAYYG
jgi:hypothetical protein